MARAPYTTTRKPRPATRGAGVAVFKPQTVEEELGVKPQLPPNQAPFRPGRAPAQVATRQLNAGRAAAPVPRSPVDPRVVQIQTRLRQLGYHVDVDGILGPVTRAAMQVSNNGTIPNAVHHPDHARAQAQRHVARVEAAKVIKDRTNFRPFYPGQKPDHFDPLTRVPVYTLPQGPGGDPSTGLNAEDAAQLQRMGIENQGGLFPYVVKKGLESLVPARSAHAIANGHAPSTGDIASDLFNGALWLTPGTVAPALRTARVAAQAFREEGVTANAIRTLREVRGAVRSASEDRAAYARVQKIARREQSMEGPVHSEVKDQLAAALEAAPNIDAKQAQAILHTNDVAARAVAHQLQTSPEHAYELMWKGAQFHDVSPTADQLAHGALAQTGREPEVTNLSQVPETHRVDPEPIARAARTLTRSLRDAAPPHAQTPKALRGLLNDLQQRAIEAADYKRWYANSAAGILQHVNGDTEAADKLAALIAVYSPRAEVYSKTNEWNNLDRAINAYDEFNETGQISPRWSISSHREGEGDWQTTRAQQIMQGNFEWHGLKTNRFYRNFLQHIDPEKYAERFGNEKFGTMDTWMRRAFGYPPVQKTEERTTLFGTEHVPVGKKGEPISDKMYAFMERATNAVADSLGWSPEEAQSAIWTSIKAESEGTPLANAGFDFRDAFIHREARRARPVQPEQLVLSPETADKPGANVVDAAIEASRAPDSGFTLTAGLNPDEGNTGYAVAYGAHEFREPAPLTRSGLLDYRNKHLALLRSDPTLRIGGWHNPDDGQVYLDVSRVFPTLDDALAFGREQGQLAIFDRGSMDVIPTGLSPEQADVVKEGLKEQGRLNEQAAKYDDLLLRAHEQLSGKTTKQLTAGAREDTENYLFDWAERNPDVPEASMFRDLYHDAKVARSAPDPELLFQDDALVQSVASAHGQSVDRAKILDAHAGRDLKGLPEGRRSNRNAQEIANTYMRNRGMPYSPPTEYAAIDEDRARRIADWYDQAVSAPDDPEVRAAYEAMANETRDQYNAIIADGYVFEFYPEGIDPYPSGPSAAIDDLRSNKHLYVFPTDAGFGSAAPSDEAITIRAMRDDRNGKWKVEDLPNGYTRIDDRQNGLVGLFNPDGTKHSGDLRLPSLSDVTTKARAREYRQAMSAPVQDHPLLNDSGIAWGGKPTTDNDIFRAVHDFFGHYKEGVGFRAEGEENAWRAHSAMYSPDARRAMTAETRGQNSWVNFGPHGAANKTAKQGETVYADQKAVLAPDWAVHEGSGSPVIKGAVERSPGEGHFLHLFRGADVSTALHELGHAIEGLMPAADRELLAAHGLDDPETFARSVERYFADGGVPDPSLRGVMNRLARGMTEVYGRTGRIPGAVASPEIRRVFDSFFQREAARDPQWAAQVGASAFFQTDDPKTGALEAAAMQHEQGGASLEDAAKMFGLDPAELRAHIDSGTHAKEQERILSNEDVGAGAAETEESADDIFKRWFNQEETPPPPPADWTGVTVSDAAKALADEHGIGPNDVKGTGADGGIVKDDIEREIRQRMAPEDQVRLGLRGARSARGRQEAAYSVERAARAAKVKTAQEEIGGMQGHYAALKALKGELPKIDFQGLTELTPDSLEALARHIQQSTTLMPLQKTRAIIALEKATSGRVPTRSELTLLENVFGKATADGLASISSMEEKLRNSIVELLNVPRALMASFDLSAPFRQGLVVMARHPVLSARNFKPMVRSFGSEKVYEGTMNDILSRTTYPLMQRAKLAITYAHESIGTREEQFFGGNYAARIPIAGRAVKASERAYVSYLDKTRADVFDLLIHNAAASGIDVQNEKFLRDLGRYINSATGRGTFNSETLERSMPFLNTMLFSPRLLASRLNFLSPRFYVKLDPFVRREALRSALQLVGAITTVLGLAKEAGAKVTTDPRNADFAKIKIGNTRVDIAGSFQQPIRLLAQIASGTVISSTTGDPLQLGPQGPGKLSRKDVAQRFIEGKLAPVPSMVNDLAKGTTFMGQPITVKDELAQHFIPLLAQDAASLYQAAHGGMDGITAAVAGYAVGSVGFGIQNYAPKNVAEKPKNKLAAEAKAAGMAAPSPEILLALDHKENLDHAVRTHPKDPQGALKAVVDYYAQETGKHDFDKVVKSAKGNDELARQFIGIIRTVMVGPGLSAYESAVKTVAEAKGAK